MRAVKVYTYLINHVSLECKRIFILYLKIYFYVFLMQIWKFSESLSMFLLCKEYKKVNPARAATTFRWEIPSPITYTKAHNF